MVALRSIKQLVEKMPKTHFINLIFPLSFSWHSIQPWALFVPIFLLPLVFSSSRF
jgi:hypothetical protein